MKSKIVYVLRSLVGVILVLSYSLASSESIFGAADLGKITHSKLKSFSGYFEPYLKHDPPFYPNEEREKKIVAEARGIFDWLNHSANWPKEEKITAEMKADAARLFHYLSRTGISGASEKAEEYARNGAKEHQDSFEVQISACRTLVERGDSAAYEGAVLAERVLTLDQRRAESENAHYYAGLGFYRSGHFRKGYEHLERQLVIKPDFENTEDLMFVLKSQADRWGRLPEKVIFEKNEQGDRVPKVVD